MNFPLTLSFKILALAPQISVSDANGALVCYVRQALFKLKESVTVYADAAQQRPLAAIKADRILDWSARYNFTDAQGMALGAVKRQGMRSLWRAHYDILDGDMAVMTIREENPWIKVLDGLIGEVPVLGFFSGYLFHPVYAVARPDGAVVLRMKKQPAFFEGRFRIEQVAPLNPAEEQRALLSLIMMLLLERSRG